MVRSASLVSLALLLSAAPAPGRAAEDVPREAGVYWEQSVEMQMSGFSMPAQKQKICVPKQGLEEPPRGRDDGKCEMTDVKRTGPRMTWKMRCKDGTTGEGDITSGPDSFDGTMTMHTQGHDATMKMKGKKLGGECDAGELKRKVAGMQKQVEEQQAQLAESRAKRCEDAARRMEVGMFVPPYPNIPVQCADSARFCANLDTREGLAALLQAGKQGAAQAGKLCRKDVDALAEKHCAAAAKEQQKATRFSDEASLEFVFGWCPDLARTLAKRECAGRKFTALPEAQRTFCTRWAQKGLEGEGAEPVREVPARQVPAAASGKYLGSGIPDMGVDDKPAKKDEKKKAKKPADEDEDAPAKKNPEDMKSRIMKGLFGN